jgi:hypothetical protein
MKKAFQEGWGGVIAKTVSLDSSKVVNVTPRYAKMRGSNGKDVRRISFKESGKEFSCNPWGRAGLQS